MNKNSKIFTSKFGISQIIYFDSVFLCYLATPIFINNKFLGGAGSNKQHAATKNTAKLDRETEELKHEHISLDVGKLIQQGRQAKNMSQKELATKINEKPQVITDYEAGRGIPNNIIIGKIERAIGLKLRGKDRGKPVLPPGKTH